MKNVGVFFGGQSVEHDVSIITGALTVNSIDKNLYNAIPIYISKTGEWFTGEKLKDIDEYKNLDLSKLTPVTLKLGSNELYAIKGKKIKPLAVLAVAINCMHGERGEDGSLSGLLDMCAIPLASPPTLGSSVCMDKSFTKTVLKGLKIKALPSVSVTDNFDLKKITSKIKFPVIVKPARLGSSIGVERADDLEELSSAIAVAKRYGDRVIVEPFLKNFIEINCAAYRAKDGEVVVSECERPVGKGSLLSFDDKYMSGKRVFPADIEADISERIKITTKRAYEELYLEGVVRMDYMAQDGEVYLNEINTVPGSLAFYLFGETLASFTDMLSGLIARAERKANEQASVQKSFRTGILNMGGIKSKNACKKR